MRGMLQKATSFNKDIGNWNVSNVQDMGWMFKEASSFNQDLSGWCVEKISEEPVDFDTDANAWILPDSRPVWGTCPN